LLASPEASSASASAGHASGPRAIMPRGTPPDELISTSTFLSCSSPCGHHARRPLFGSARLVRLPRRSRRSARKATHRRGAGRHRLRQTLSSASSP
jgi:hypothetical protein